MFRELVAALPVRAGVDSPATIARQIVTLIRHGAEGCEGTDSPG